MQAVEVTSESANIRVIALENGVNREWLMRHALHQIIREYRKAFGSENTEQLMNELASYHVPRVTGIR